MINTNPTAQPRGFKRLRDNELSTQNKRFKLSPTLENCAQKIRGSIASWFSFAQGLEDDRKAVYTCTQEAIHTWKQIKGSTEETGELCLETMNAFDPYSGIDLRNLGVCLAENKSIYSEEFDFTLFSITKQLEESLMNPEVYNYVDQFMGSLKYSQVLKAAKLWAKQKRSISDLPREILNRIINVLQDGHRWNFFSTGKRMLDLAHYRFAEHLHRIPVTRSVQLAIDGVGRYADRIKTLNLIMAPNAEQLKQLRLSFPSLTILSVAANTLYQELRNFTQLQELTLKIGNLKSLDFVKSLSIQRLSISCSNSELVPFEALVNSKVLKLDVSNAYGPGVGNLDFLTSLQIKEITLSEVNLATDIPITPSIERVNFTGWVSDDAIIRLQQVFPNLNFISLDSIHHPHGHQFELSSIKFNGTIVFQSGCLLKGYFSNECFIGTFDTGSYLYEGQFTNGKPGRLIFKGKFTGSDGVPHDCEQEFNPELQQYKNPKSSSLEMLDYNFYPMYCWEL